MSAFASRTASAKTGSVGCSLMAHLARLRPDAPRHFIRRDSMSPLQEKRWSGFREPTRLVGNERVLPRRMVSRLPQRGQRTRRFSHPGALLSGSFTG